MRLADGDRDLCRGVALSERTGRAGEVDLGHVGRGSVLNGHAGHGALAEAHAPQGNAQMNLKHKVWIGRAIENGGHIDDFGSRVAVIPCQRAAGGGEVGSCHGAAPNGLIVD